MVEIQPVRKGEHITDEQRRELAAKLRTLYEGGATIAGLAEKMGRSYTFVRALLNESDVEMRPRGQPRKPGKKRRRIGCKHCPHCIEQAARD